MHPHHAQGFVRRVGNDVRAAWRHFRVREVIGSLQMPAVPHPPPTLLLCPLVQAKSSEPSPMTETTICCTSPTRLDGPDEQFFKARRRPLNDDLLLHRVFLVDPLAQLFGNRLVRNKRVWSAGWFGETLDFDSHSDIAQSGWWIAAVVVGSVSQHDHWPRQGGEPR